MTTIAPALLRATPACTARSVARGLRRLQQVLVDRRGVAAVEFAIILPLMLLMYIGSIDVTRGVIASRNTNLLSRTISDLVSQENTAAAIPSSELALAFAAASAVMAPYDTTSLTMTVSAVDISADPATKKCCQYLVRWTYTQGGTLRPCTTALKPVDASVTPAATNIPSALGDANNAAGLNYASGQTSYVIVADVTYTYSPLVSTIYSFGGSTRKTTFMVPRSVSNPIKVATSSTSYPAAIAAGGAGQSGTVCFN